MNTNSASKKVISMVCLIAGIILLAVALIQDIALAYQGDAITQIESYDNGWSKVEYKGETGYVKTEFLE